MLRTKLAAAAMAAAAITAAATTLATASAAPAAGGVATMSTMSTMSTRTMLRQLVVAPVHGTGYARSAFKLWDDADHDGCNTRYEVLIAEAVRKPHVGAGCTLTGGKWFSPYDGVTTTDPSTFDIDHLVPLAEAWKSGAWRWSAATRERYANDLGYGPDLVAVSAHANRSKGDDQPSAYLPPRTSFDCTYEAWWVAVKWRWHLSVDRAEKSWLFTHLAACHWPSVARPTRPTIGAATGGGGGGTSAASGVRIVTIYFDSPGSDTGSNASLNAEWVRLKNVTGTRKAIGGWTLRDAASHVYRFPSVRIAAGRTVRVHTGSGTDTATDLYWHSDGYIWNNTGDTATLRNAHGTFVSRCSYTSSDDPAKSC